MKALKRILFGLLFIAGAVTIILESMNIISIGLTVANIVFSTILLIIFIDSLLSLHFFGMIMAPTIIAILFRSQLGIEAITPWPLLFAALFVSIGLNIIFGKRPHHTCKTHNYHKDVDSDVITGSDNAVDIFVKFGETIKYLKNDNLEYVNCDVSFGAAKIYFDQAKLKDNKVILNVNIAFAGVEIYIPKEWKVINEASSSLGGFDEKGAYAGENGENTIIIKGSTSFSGVDIIYI